MVLFKFIGLLLTALEILIIVRVLLSFVPAWRRTPWGTVVVALTEPVLLPLRAIARVGSGSVALDFSPMIALGIIHIVRLLLPFI